METDRRLLNLTLEIIYLLTGENYIAFKLSDGLGSSNLKNIQSPVLEHPSYSFGISKKKVQEVTSEIIELLTGEVFTVYFCTEKGKYIGHRDLHDDIMMENQLPLTSPDGSSNRSTPERCPRPLYSRDPTQEHDNIHYLDEHDFQCRTEEREESEESYVRDDDPCKEEEIPPEIGTDTQRDVKAEEEEGGRVRIKEEEIPIEISTGGPHIDTDPEEHQNIPAAVQIEDDDLTSSSSKENHITLILHPAPHNTDLSSDLSTLGGSSSAQTNPVTYYTSHGHPNRFPCSERGTCSSERSSLDPHGRTHAGEKSVTYSECGESFDHKVILSHQRKEEHIKPYSCPKCGKCFPRKSNLVRHERIHTGEKPFSCSECGKGFSQRAHLITHLRTHTGDKPYTCLECGRRYTHKSSLVSHINSHRGQDFLVTGCGT